MRGNCGTRAHPRSAATRHYRGPGDGCAGLDRRAEARLCDRRQPAWGTPPASEVEGLVVSFAGTGISARDHSASMAKKPMTFSTICRASSRLRSRPRRGFQTSRVRSITLSFAACDGFTEDFTVGFGPFRASGLRLRHPTDNLGPLCHVHLWRPHPRDHRWFVSYSGTSGSMIENLWPLPALTISSRRPPEPVSQVIE